LKAKLKLGNQKAESAEGKIADPTPAAKRRLAITIGLILAIAECVFLFAWHTVSRARVSSILGGKQILDAIASADQVQVFQTVGHVWEKTNGFPPAPKNSMNISGQGQSLNADEVRRLKAILLNPHNYRLDDGSTKLSVFSPQIILKFQYRGKEVQLIVDIESADIVTKRADQFGNNLDISPAGKELSAVLAPFL
jgi:hypothetical protein